MSKFSRQHYNAIAADIREELEPRMKERHFHPRDSNALDEGIDALVKLALRFAKRFQDDNENFDPLKFLDACSPDVDLYPLSELWEVSE